MKKLATILCVMVLAVASVEAASIVSWSFYGYEEAPSVGATWTDTNGADLVSHYPFSPTVTNADGFVDDIIGTNVGTLLPSFAGGPVWTITSTNENGRVEYCFVLDGNDNAIRVNGIENHVRPDDGRFTISAWFNYDGVSSRNIFTITDTDGVLNYMSLGLRGDTGLARLVQALGGIVSSVDGTSDLRSDGWHHIAYTATSNDVMSMYVDGRLQNTDTRSGTQTGIDSVHIGAFLISCAANYFGGSLYDVRVYDEAIPSNGVWEVFYYTPPVRNFPNANPGGNIEVR